jgi:hypothetical protein
MRRTFIGFILILAILAGLGVLGWYFVKDRVRLKPEHRLSADKIIVSDTPPWVPDRFIEDVLQSSGLNRTGSLLDATLPQKLAEAFAAHPWVEKVEQVVPRYPSGADVKLSYRTPAALVEVPKHGIFLVDRNGVLLPPDYLSETTTDWRSEYLAIRGIQSMPLGSVGTPWGDQMVHTAAQLANTLKEVAEPLKLGGIIPVMEETPGGPRIVCRLRTVAGTEIHWGSFVLDDPKTETKIKKLRDFQEQYRSLDNVPAAFRDLSRE